MILGLITSLFTALVFYVLYTYFLRPYLDLQYYKRQGGTSKFYWELVSLPTLYRNAIAKGDFYYDQKQMVNANPPPRFLVENFGSRCFITLIDPHMIREMFQRHEIYQKDRLAYGLVGIVSEGSIIFSEETTWKKRRKLLSNTFNFEFFKQSTPTIIEIVQEKLDEWKRKSELKNVELVSKLAEITGEVTGRLFFGKSFSKYKLNGASSTTKLIKLIADAATESFTPWVFMFGPKLVQLGLLKRHRQLKRDMEAIRKYCGDLIDQTKREAKKEDNNLLSLLLNHQKSDVEQSLTDHQVIGEFIGLFSAGTDTTSHLINSVIYFLWKYPEVFCKVKEEIDREFIDSKSLTLDHLNRMEYLTAVLKETMRIGGPLDGVFFRSPIRDDDLCGLKIKKGTLVNVIFNLNFTSPKYFTDPEKFIPERWLSQGPYSQDSGKTEPYVYIPFSAGPRTCLGQHLGMLEAKIIVGLFVKNFEFSLPEDYKFILVTKLMHEPMIPITATLTPKNS